MRIASIRRPRPGGPFLRALKRLTKRKGLPTARRDIEGELALLADANRPGVPCPPRVSVVPGIGLTVLKVRVSSSDMQKGRSGGFRVLLVLCDESDWEWAPFFAYVKPDRVDVSRKDALAMAREELATDSDRGPRDE